MQKENKSANIQNAVAVAPKPMNYSAKIAEQSAASVQVSKKKLPMCGTTKRRVYLKPSTVSLAKDYAHRRQIYMMEKHADLDGYSSAEIVEQLANKILAPILDSALKKNVPKIDKF